MISLISSHWIICTLSYIGLSLFTFLLWYAYAMASEGKDSNELSELIVGLIAFLLLLPAIAIYWIFVGLGELKEIIFKRKN